MVFAGAYALISLVLMVTLSGKRNSRLALFYAVPVITIILFVASRSPTAIALLLLVSTLALVAWLMQLRRTPEPNLWDASMLAGAKPARWYASLWLWWGVLAAILVGIYVKFW
jgi:hypothetical protein